MDDECQYCRLPFATLEECVAHEKAEHPEHQPWICKYCESFYLCETDYFVHMKQHRTFSCKECTFTCSSKLALKRHVGTHAPTKEFVCAKCKKCFLVREYLKKHEKRHDRDEELPCNKCSAVLKNAWRLKLHKRTHKAGE
jgi:KRAB domain-containing zinc finger protein